MFHSPLLRAAIDAAKAGEEVIRRYFHGNLGISLKADKSPVTQADVETEEAIKAVLKRAFPEHGFYGEETGRETGDSDCLWLVDPIDGTKSFIRETPFFSTQIALLRKGELVLGVSNAPLFGELAYAEAGGGAFLNDRPIRVSALDDLAEATLSTGNIKTLAADPQGWRALADLIGQVNRGRGYGDFCHYHLLAAGKLDVVLESDINILDVAALSVIVQEAGGRVTDLKGRSLDLETTSVLASNPQLHARVLDMLCR